MVSTMEITPNIIIHINDEAKTLIGIGIRADPSIVFCVLQEDKNKFFIFMRQYRGDAAQFLNKERMKLGKKYALPCGTATWWTTTMFNNVDLNLIKKCIRKNDNMTTWWYIPTIDLQKLIHADV